jgi:hypothetical protein
VRVVVVAAAAVSLSLLAGCGGSSGPPSLLTWLDKADLVCRTARGQADAASTTTSAVVGGPATSVASLRAAATRIDREARSLEAIGTPQEQATDTNALVAAVKAQASALGTLADALAADPAAADGPQGVDLAAAEQQVTAAAAALGLRACAAEASAPTTTVPGSPTGSVPPASEPGLGDGSQQGGTTQEF